jgi:hypothetical protein
MAQTIWTSFETKFQRLVIDLLDLMTASCRMYERLHLTFAANNLLAELSIAGTIRFTVAKLRYASGQCAAQRIRGIMPSCFVSGFARSNLVG